MREKLNGRLQTPLAILVSVIGVLAFMIRNFSSSGEIVLLSVFLALYLTSAINILIGITNFIRSWYGYEYSFIPSAKDTEEYRLLLVETYKDFDNCDELVRQHFTEYLSRYYVECSSINTGNNDDRSQFLHLTNKHIIIGATFAFLSFIPFYLGGLDKSQKEVIQSVRISGPIHIQEVVMNEDKSQKQPEKPTPPDPPPPPPKRVIKEGVKPKPSNKD